MLSDKKHNLILVVIFFGSLWGLSEASLGGWLYGHEISYAPVVLNFISLLILAGAYVFLPFKFTGSLTALVAACFKLVNVPFFACHLWAIFVFGAGFDLSVALLTRLSAKKIYLPILGFISTYVGRILFALTITYLFRYQYWTESGLPKIINYIFISGSMAAVLGMLAVPIGNRAGNTVKTLSWPKLHPRIATTLLMAATICIWLVQRTI